MTAKAKTTGRGQKTKLSRRSGTRAAAGKARISATKSASKKPTTKAKATKSASKKPATKAKSEATKSASKKPATKAKSEATKGKTKVRATAPTRAAEAASRATKKPAETSATSAPRSAKGPKPRRLNNFVVVIFDSCRFDSFMAARPQAMAKLGEIEQRWSYASWTAPSHYNLLTGLMPHHSPQNVYASEYYKKDFLKYSERLGLEGTSFKALIPHLYFPVYLKGLGYSTHARVSLPVLNPRTTLNNGFDSFRLMKSHNDMRAMVEEMHFSDDHPSFWLLNVGETHYPYALPDEPPDQWPRISGVHGVFKHLDDHVVGGKVTEEETKFFDDQKMRELQQRQIRAVQYLDKVVEELFDIVPRDTYITITADHGELFGENGYFGHGPINHDKVFEVPFVEGKLK